MPGTKISPKSLDLLKRGIELAKSNQKPRARRLFREAVYEEPRNEMAWLWLASVAETHQEALASIDQALAISPGNRAAADWLQRLQHKIHSDQHPPDSPQTTGSEPLQQVVGYLDLERLREALDYLRAAAELQPDNERLQKMVGRLTRRLQGIPPTAAGLSGSPEAPKLPSETDPGAEAEQTFSSTGAAPSPTAPRGGTVLVADDDPETRSVVVETLAPLGYQVLEATSGLETMARLDQCVPDLILLSTALGQLDGYQALRLIKSNALTQSVPVILLRQSNDFLGTLRSRLSRVDLTLTKPLRPSQLEQAVVRFFGSS